MKVGRVKKFDCSVLDAFSAVKVEARCLKTIREE